MSKLSFRGSGSEPFLLPCKYGKPFVTKIVFLQGVKKNYNDSF